ncbi:amino acid adenylation domain-containing protein [Spirillospora sp. CA-294931]|uniref:non-ribosomal peptide synthetase family protein n=1 Tax=Spirillospora sp. CA-294931 TaxID=3240042 RepID=UPI003D8E8109
MIPLSFAQRGLWFIDQLEGPGSTYNVPLAFRLSGRVDTAALDLALRDVAGRHEALRMIFRERDGDPCLLILDPEDAPVRLTVEEVPADRLMAAVDEAGRRPFDLGAEPQFRAWLMSSSPDEHVLLILMHHIVTDGWSMAPLTRDLATAYSARLAGGAPEWEELPVQFSDYVRWQHDVLGTEDDLDSLASRQLAYWREALDGLPEELRLPADRPRPPVATRGGDVVLFDVDRALHRDLAELARESGATLYMVLQAALATLLTRLGAGTDIPIGVPLAGRTEEVLDDLVGYFINTVVMRADTSGDPTFRETLARVRTASLAAHEHQDLPFDRLVEVLNPPRARGRHPLFQIMLGFQSKGRDGLDLPGVTALPLELHSGDAMFDLNIDVFERLGDQGEPAGLEGGVEYARDLFDRATAESIATRLVRLLAAVAREPDTPIGRLELLADDERAWLLEEWNDTAVPVPEATPPELFEACAARTPDAVAIEAPDATLTYAQLNARANRLARHLIDQGAGPDRIVALSMPRSAALIVALLATVKAGAAYLAIDPGHPADRVEAMLADARPVCVLDAAEFAGLDERSAGNVTDAERERALLPGNAVYVIYTSGSTGTPKGVVITHRSLANYLAWSSDACHALDGTTILHTSVAFDFTVTTILSPLVAGGRVRVAELNDLVTEDPGGDGDGGTTFLKVTPSHLPLVHELPERHAPSRQLMLCGEPLPTEAVADWQRRHPDVEVIGAYGPTETTVESSWHVLDPPGTLTSPLVPLGRPVWNTRLYVLDERLRPAPTGVTGEVYVAGAGLARGYLGRPDMTAERFVACPFGGPGERMYRTGDLARRRADGRLEPAGRVDDQVKVRGHRVEPGEIEAVLTRHPAVRQAAVAVREERPGDARLAAYVVASGADPAELRSHVAALLPGYMVPAAFVVLDRMPLTRNGKVDRRALPAPDFASGASRYVAPRTRHEELVAAAYGEVLGLPRVGVEDDFFELGGHSLLAARLMFRLRKVIEHEVTIAMVFAHPTPAELARAVVEGDETGPTGPVLDESADEFVTTGLPRAEPGGHILLTGATGYFGAFLLAELLERTGARISCLVRAADAEAGLERVRRNLERFGRWTPDARARVTAVPGDLALPRLGLDDAEFARLAATVTAIYHNGANVNLMLPLEAVSASNLGGTRELLRLAATTTLKPFQLVSTDARAGGNGYVLSKRSAERLVLKARERGLPASVYRVPRLSLDTRTALGNERDAGLRLLGVIRALGAAPDFDIKEMWMPVDGAARAVTGAALADPDGGPFTVVTEGGPITLRGMVEVVRAAGVPVALNPVAEWVEKVRAAGSEENEVMLGVLGLNGEFDPGGEHVVYEDPAGFGGLIEGPRVSAETIGRYLATRSGQ